MPADGEVAGLLALMLLTDARRPARVDAGGLLVPPLAEQDRSRWDQALVAEGVALVSATLGRTPVGPYQLQAAIAAIHDEARTAADTDWPQILACYDLLERISPGPVVTLNRAVAVAMVHGALAGWRCSAPWARTSGWPAATGWTPSASTKIPGSRPSPGWAGAGTAG